MTDRPIVFLDTETNGLHADRRPWEIAWIRREPDGTETERCIQIADVDNTNAELKGLQVGRFHERWKGGPKASATLISKSWNEKLGLGGVFGGETILLEFDAAHLVEQVTRGAIIVGAVPSFDTEVLAAMLRRHKLCPSWYYNLVDVENMAMGWLAARPASVPIIKRLIEARAELSWQQVLTNKVRSFAAGTPSRDDAELKLKDRTEDLAAIESELAALLSPDCRSDDLSRACGVEPPTEEERHTALGDARWVKSWYDHIIGGA
ncbi:hypothetical protein [Rhodococcus pyridinivorans]|uniref:hypothetical protein n=1 Tax=Rhodococcus pyridinivorans TaxID=103816 RepID=UPI003AAA4818